MASHNDANSNSQQLLREGNEAAGQAQERKEGVMDQAGSFLQQTGEQVKNMAAGAADAVKNTLGMNSGNNTVSDAAADHPASAAADATKAAASGASNAAKGSGH